MLLPVQPPIQASPVAVAAPARSSKLQPPNASRTSDIFIELLLGIIAVVVLFGLIEAATRNVHPTSSTMALRNPSEVANGTAAMGGIESVVTDYTTFNTVLYRSWKVVTGWNYANSRVAQPDRQYCYLEVPTMGGRQAFSIEERNPVEQHDIPQALVPGLNKTAWDEAATKCVWHR